MTDNTENLMLEHLKRFQAGQERIEKKLDEVVSRLGNLEMSVAGIRRDLAHLEENDAIMSVRMDRLNERVERIERRLELA
jgi:chromosome segregation ATPase